MQHSAVQSLRLHSVCPDFVAAGRVPQPSGVISAPGQHETPVRADRHNVDSIRMSAEGAHLLAAVGVLQPPSARRFLTARSPLFPGLFRLRKEERGDKPVILLCYCVLKPLAIGRVV